MLKRKLRSRRKSRTLNTVYHDGEPWVEMPDAPGRYDSDLQPIREGVTCRRKIKYAMQTLGWFLADLIVGQAIKRFVANAWSRR